MCICMYICMYAHMCVYVSVENFKKQELWRKFFGVGVSQSQN